MPAIYWSKDEITHIIIAVCGTAHDFGGFTPEAAAIAGRLCQALDIVPALPEPTRPLIITVIQPPALPEPGADGVPVILRRIR